MCLCLPYSNSLSCDDCCYWKVFSLCIHTPTFFFLPSLGPCSFVLFLSQVMETKNMLYLVTEYAKNGEIFGEWSFQIHSQSDLSIFKKKHCPTLAIHIFCMSVAPKIWNVASVMFLSNKSIKVSLSLPCSFTIPASISKVTHLMDIWEQCPDMALVMCCW